MCVCLCVCVCLCMSLCVWDPNTPTPPPTPNTTSQKMHLALGVEGLRPAVGLELESSRLRGMCGTVGLSWLDARIGEVRLALYSTCSVYWVGRINRPRGPMDKASAHGAGDCRFESCRGQTCFYCCGIVREFSECVNKSRPHQDSKVVASGSRESTGIRAWGPWL